MRQFSFRKLKKCSLIMFLTVLILVICLALFAFHTDHKQIFDNAQKVKLYLQHPTKTLEPSAVKSDNQSHVKPVKGEINEQKQNEQIPQRKPEVPRHTTMTPRKQNEGEANMHVFEDWCGSSIEQLRKNVLYPLYPHTRTTIRRLAIYPKWTNYGVRMFGYIHPAISGEYIFAISSDKNSEFWLSLNETLQGLRLLAYVGKTGAEWAGPGEYGKFASQISQPVTLSKDQQYFFEVLFKHSEGVDHVEVAWRLNQRNSTFTVITSKYLSLYADEFSLLSEDTTHIPQTEASRDMHYNHTSVQPDPEVDMVREDPRDFIYKIPLMNNSFLRDVFPECDHKPINVFEGAKMQRYRGVFFVYYSAVYPNDHTRQTHTDIDEMCFYNKDNAFRQGGGFPQYLKINNTGPEGEINQRPDPNWERVFDVNPIEFHSKQPFAVASVCKRAGNIILDEQDVKPVVEAFMNQLKSTSNNSELVLKRILNVEKRMDGDVNGRYLLELELEDRQGQNMLLSRYFYVTRNKEDNPESPQPPALCSSQGFSWNPAATVNVILPVKNQGRWVIQFIKQMERIYQATRDKNFNIILVDYSSTDIDIQEVLKTAKIPSYQYIRLEGTFLKTTAVQTAIDLVKNPYTNVEFRYHLPGQDPSVLNVFLWLSGPHPVFLHRIADQDENSILFTCDLHLNFPLSIIDTVRKHCIQGKMIFAPAVMRLDCGATAQAPTGFWEIDGYGLIGIYKSDMDRIGGMNTRDFKDKWGGEDWELLDRILENRLEVERLNLRNFLHYHHSKRGMWNS